MPVRTGRSGTASEWSCCKGDCRKDINDPQVSLIEQLADTLADHCAGLGNPPHCLVYIPRLYSLI